MGVDSGGANLGSAYVAAHMDSSPLQVELVRIRLLIEKQLSIASLSFQKLGSSFTAVSKKSAVARKSMKKTFKESIKSALSLERVVSRLAFIGTVGAVYALGRALKSALGDGIKDAIAFEKAMAHVNTVLDDTAKHYLPAFKKGIEDIAVTFGVSVLDLSKGLYDILSARIPPDFALDVLNASTELAVANQAKLKDVIQAVVGTMNAYKMSASEVNVIIDKFQATVKFGRMELQEIATILGKVTSAAAAMGISLDDVLGSLATMTRQGMNARESVTALRRMLLKLSQDYELSAMIQKEGLLSVIPILKLMTRQQQIMFAGGIRGFNAAIIAMQNYIEQGRDVEAITNSEAEALKALGIELDTSATKFAIHREEVKKSWRTASENLLPTIVYLSEAFAQLTTNMITPMAKFPQNIFDIAYARDVFDAMENIQTSYRNMIDEILRKQVSIKWDPFDIPELKSLGELDDKAITERKDALKSVLELHEKEYKLAKEKSEGEKETLKRLIATQQEYFELLKAISEKGKGWSVFKLQAIDAEIKLHKLLNEKLKEEGKSLKTNEEILRDINKVFRFDIKTLEARDFFGEDVRDEIIALWDTMLTEVEKLNHDLFLQLKREQEEYMTDLLASTALIAKAIRKSGMAEAPLQEAIEASEGWLAILGDKYVKTAEFLTQTTDALFESMSDGLANSFEDMLTGAKSWKEAFEMIFQDIWKSFAAMISKMIAEWLMFQAFTLIGLPAKNPFGATLGAGRTALPAIPLGTGGGMGGGTPQVINNNFSPNFNPSFNAKFSQRDMAFIVQQGQKYLGKTTI